MWHGEPAASHEFGHQDLRANMRAIEEICHITYSIWNVEMQTHQSQIDVIRGITAQTLHWLRNMNDAERRAILTTD